jgi:hypothetical protein
MEVSPHTEDDSNAQKHSLNTVLVRLVALLVLRSVTTALGIRLVTIMRAIAMVVVVVAVVGDDVAARPAAGTIMVCFGRPGLVLKFVAGGLCMCATRCSCEKRNAKK